MGFKILSYYIVFLVSCTFLSIGLEAKTYGKDSLKIKKVSVVEIRPSHSQKTSVSAGTPSDSGSNAKWTQITIRYQTKKEWIEHLNFKFFVQVGKGKKSAVLEGDVSYLYVHKANQHTAVAYIHPLVIERFGNVERVAILIDGDEEIQLAAHYPNPTKQEWWKDAKARPGLVRNSLLTPFYDISPDQNELLQVGQSK